MSSQIAPNPSRFQGIREVATFLKNAFTSSTICAVVPSSMTTVKQVCREIPTDRPQCIVEYGPGTGVFTRYLAETLHPESSILAIELHEPFHQELCDWRAATNPRVNVVLENTSCTDVNELLKKHGLGKANFTLSGIPFSVFTEELRSEIVNKTHESLRPGGSFFVYQYSFFMTSRLENVFGRVDKDRSILNLPPTMIMRARKAQ